MKYFIGIDGGGTKTHCIVTDVKLNHLFECFGGPSNFLMLGTEKVCETIFELLEKARNEVKFTYDQVESVVIGTTGAGRRSDAEKLESAFLIYLQKQKINLKDFYVESDARIALESAFSGHPGSILIAGTGSIMFGKDEQGAIHRVGGFGRFIGDEGSGFMIGKKGLIAVSKNFDGRGKNTILNDLLKQKFNIDSPELLITEIYKNNFDIASFAPIVLEAAEKGDEVALRILEEETDELILHFKAMKKKLKTEIMNVSFIGGIISNKNIFSDLLSRKIINDLPGVNVKIPDYEPPYGAILLAKQRLDKKF